MTSYELSRERVSKYLRHEPEIGHLYWIRNTGRGPSKVGQIAGTLSSNGYIHVGILGYKTYAHRIAWLLSYGYLPKELDHINGIRDDNRLVNLREVTRTQNNANTNPLNRGVFITAEGRFLAYISFNYNRRYLGTYLTREEAQLVYNMAADKVFGEYARINRPID